MIASIANVSAAVVALVLHFRDENRTFACFESLLADGVRRIVVVDNSEDAGRSLQRLRAQCMPLLRAGLELHVCEPMVNLGFAKGVNLGLREAGLKFGSNHVLLLNNDALLVAGASSQLLSASILANAEALVAPTLVTPVGDFSSLAWYQPHLALILRRRLPGALPHLGGCCLLIPPRLAAKPLLDEDFFFYGEDFELGARCVRHGIRLIGEDRAKVIHAMSIGSRNGSLFYEYHMARAHLMVVAKVARNSLEMAVMWLGRGVMLPLRALLRASRNRSLNPLRGLWLAAADVARGRMRALTPPAD